MKLYKHQQQAVDETTALIALGSEKVGIEAPTSWGKSLAIAELARVLPGKVAIVVTFTPLIEQISEHLDELNVEHSILKAGMEDKFDINKRVQVVMKQTYHARRDKLDLKVEYMIKDEVHVEWFGQKRMDEIYSSLGSPILVGLSATPYDSKGYKLKGLNDIVRTKGVKELTEEGYLTPVKYFVPKFAEQIDYTKFNKAAGDYSEADIDSVVLEDEYMDEAIKAMVRMDIANKKTIIFANSIEHAELVASKLIEKNVKAYPYHSKQDKRLSESIIGSFKSNEPTTIDNNLVDGSVTIDCQCIVAINRISIGFSVKDIQLGVMMRKTAVRSLYYQQVGRLIRTFPGKEYVELLDLANNVATFGFADEPYNPPEYGNKEALAKEEARLSASTIGIIVNNEPTEVTRALVLEAVKELERKKHKSIHELSISDLLNIFETTDDPKWIIHIGFEMNQRKYGIPYQESKVKWATEIWYPFIDKFPQYKSRILRTMKTRMKNIVAKGKKPVSMRFFVEFLMKNPPYKNEIEYNLDYNITDDEAYENIYSKYEDHPEIPF